MDSRRLALTSLSLLMLAVRAWGAAGPACAYAMKSTEMSVPSGVKVVVLRKAGVPWNRRGEFVFDSTVPQEWGGQADADNVMLMSPAQASRKYGVEVFLAECVCSGQTQLSTAKAAIVVWERYLKGEAPFDPYGRCPVRP
jgi:hypothetical protein